MKSYPCSCNGMCTCITEGCCGITGPTGPQGIPGPQGEQGIRGVTGPQGPRGVAGPQGPQGVEGPRGPQGLVGSEGPQGEQGATGPEGMRGPTGSQGPAGERGPAGPQGIQGITGPQGIAGPTGNTGPTGASGGIRRQEFAGFTITNQYLEDTMRLPLNPYLNESNATITSINDTTLQLQPGVYDISYEVSGLIRAPGYLQVTPYYNNAPHLEQGAYDNGQTMNENIQGNRRFLLSTPDVTVFFLQFNTSTTLSEGEVHLTIIKLITSEDTL